MELDAIFFQMGKEHPKGMCENEVKSAYYANLSEKIHMENWKRHVDDYRYELIC